MSRQRFRSIFISDVHLGLRDCQAAYLLDFLRSTSCEHLYLVGDILDIENLQRSPFWHAQHGEVVAEILGSATRGTRVTYIPGNHDAALRRFAGQRFGGVEVALSAVHVGADGRRYRVSHGDEFDSDHESVDPTDQALDRVQAVELHPYALVELGPLDEFQPAAVRRGIVSADAIVALRGAAQGDLGIDRDALRSARGKAMRIHFRAAP